MTSFGGKRLLFGLFLFIMFSLLITGCPTGGSNGPKITISPKAIVLEFGEQQLFKAVVVGTPKDIKWSASGGTIKDGLFTAGSKEGDYSVTASLTNEPEVKDLAKVKIIPKTEAVWSKWFSSKQDDELIAVAVDKESAVFAVGSTQGSLLGFENKGKKDSFLIKYDKNGKILWKKWFGSKEDDLVKDVAVDSEGSVYVVGATKGSLFGVKNLGSFDAFVVKYAKNGSKLWHRILATHSEDLVRAVAIDSKNNVFIAGDAGADLINQKHDGIFIMKFDKGGKPIHSDWHASSSFDYVSSLAVDMNDNVYLAGWTWGSLFGETNKGAIDTFIIKYNADGRRSWHKWFGSKEGDIITAVGTDSSGNIYLSGQTFGELFGHNVGKYDAFLLSYSGSGAERWQNNYRGKDEDFAANVIADNLGNVYVLVNTRSEGLFNKPKYGNADCYLSKYDNTGKLIKTIKLASGRSDFCNDIDIDKDGNKIVVGYSYGSLFNDNKGKKDGFVAKFAE